MMISFQYEIFVKKKNKNLPLSRSNESLSSIWTCFQKVGCDGFLYSHKTEDQCGVCGGDNSHCITYSDTFVDHLGKAQYHRVLVLPRGAMNIRVRESENNPHLAHFLGNV